MQKELTNAGPLLNERGELCEAGYARRLIKAYDRRAIKAAGYATDPQYADKLIRLIESYGLTAYDGPPHQGMGLLPDHERKVGCGTDH